MKVWALKAFDAKAKHLRGMPPQHKWRIANGLFVGRWTWVFGPTCITEYKCDIDGAYDLLKETEIDLEVVEFEIRRTDEKEIG